MTADPVDLVCPSCRGGLEGDPWAEDGTLTCHTCPRDFPVLAGIPDLRMSPDPYIGLEEDRAKARRLAASRHEFDFAGFVAHYYENTPVVPARHARQYTRAITAAVERAEAQLEQWNLGTASEGRLIDIGCGTAPLLVAADGRVRRSVGVDIAFRWLVVARKRLEEAGLTIPLVCASADALPFADATFDVAAMASTLEHLPDQVRALHEAHRLLVPEGRLCLATPNRHSLGPDPHTGFPAGGWYPQRFTAWLVRRMGGIPPDRSLLTAGELRALLDECGFEPGALQLPAFGPGQRAGQPAWVRAALVGYDVIRTTPGLRVVAQRLGPGWTLTAGCGVPRAERVE